MSSFSLGGRASGGAICSFCRFFGGTRLARRSPSGQSQTRHGKGQTRQLRGRENSC
jgi:hypothetical protein